MSLLSVQNLKASYGNICALKSISFDVSVGECVSLIGANGAGKTTTLKTICGLLAKSSGDILYQGEPISWPTHQYTQRGIALVPEGRGVFSRLSVAENLQLGAFHRKDKACIMKDLSGIYDLFPRLHERQKQIAGTLSGGEQQMMVIARAMMSRPKLLLLDEPSMGLAPIITEKIFSAIKQIVSEGVTVLLVEQNAKLALEMSHRAYVLEGGVVTFSDTGANLLKNHDIKRAYLGEWIEGI